MNWCVLKGQMRACFVTLSTSVLFFSSLLAQADTQNFCKNPASLITDALTLLKSYDPEGTKIYDSLTDKSHFTKFLKCDVAQWALDTAVHESTHTLDHSDSWPYVRRYILLNGKQINVPQKTPDFKIVPGSFDYGFDRSDGFVQTYNIRGDSTAGATIFGLLDELNAASHGNMTAVNLWAHSPQAVNWSSTNIKFEHRDEILFFMTYLKMYLHKLRDYDIKNLAHLSQKPYSIIIRTLWKQAEFALSQTCLIQNFGDNDRMWARRLYSADEIDELSAILEQRPAIPPMCRNLGW